MVRASHSLHKNAFTMIELIFAIVIIAISVMSLPMMTQVSSSSMEKNLVQEAIFATVAEINMATTYVWDQHSLLDANDTSSTFNDLSRVLNTTVGDCFQTGGEIDIDGTPLLRKLGHINRRCIKNSSTGRLITSNHDEYKDSLEVPEHGYEAIFTGTTSAAGYKQAYDSSLNITNCDTGNCQQFGTISNNIDLKEIEVSIRKEDDLSNEVVTLLRTYSANIGEVAYTSKGL